MAPMVVELSGLHSQALHGFSQHQTTIHTLGSAETDLTGDGEELVQALERTAPTIGDPEPAPVVLQDHLVSGGDFRHEGEVHGSSAAGQAGLPSGRAATGTGPGRPSTSG